MTKNEIAKMIDHTQLSAVAVQDDIEKLCAEAIKYGFASVCVNPVYVPFAAKLLLGSGVKVCTVIGFPLGADATEDKAAQAANSVEKGADEVDMVINLGATKAGQFAEVERDIFCVVQAARTVGKSQRKTVVVKVILETCYLTDEEIKEVCLCAKQAGADFVKTSTGFATPKDKDGNALFNGATVHAVEIMRKTVGDCIGIKASGGIRSARTALDMISAGATRLGTSSGVTILEDMR